MIVMTYFINLLGLEEPGIEPLTPGSIDALPTELFAPL